MKDLLGGSGSLSGLALRIGQFLFAVCSFGLMTSTPAPNLLTASFYMKVAMFLQGIWSFGLACVDIHAVWTKKDIRSRPLLDLIVVCDWVIVGVSLSAACSSAGLAVFYATDLKMCKAPHTFPYCHRQFKIVTGLTFGSWFLTAVSSVVNFFLLASSN